MGMDFEDILFNPVQTSGNTVFPGENFSFQSTKARLPSWVQTLPHAPLIPPTLRARVKCGTVA